MKYFSYICITLLLLLALLVVGSWIVTVLWPDIGLRSMLTETGIRWFVGRFTENMMTTVLVFMILASFAAGAIRGSRILPALSKLLRHTPLEYRQRIALQATGLTLILILITLSYTLFTPHALLLGATGHLVPGPFAIGSIPMLSLILIILSTVYGSIAHSYRTLTHVFTTLCHGFTLTAPLFLLYILFLQLYHSCLYVLCL